MPHISMNIDFGNGAGLSIHQDVEPGVADTILAQLGILVATEITEVTEEPACADDPCDCTLCRPHRVRVGSIVRCVVPPESWFTRGKTYTVTSISDPNYPNRIMVTDDDGDEGIIIDDLHDNGPDARFVEVVRY